MTNEYDREVKYVHVGTNERGQKILEIYRTPREALRTAMTFYEGLQKGLYRYGIAVGHLEAQYRAATAAITEAKTAHIGNVRWKPSGPHYEGLLTPAWDEYALVGTTVQDRLVDEVAMLYDAAGDYGEANFWIELGVSPQIGKEEESMLEIYQMLLETKRG